MDEKQKEKQKKDQWLNDIRHVLSTAQGRRFYWGVMARCKAFSDEYIADTNLCYFRKGQRSIGIGMLNELLEADQRMYLQMVQEQESKEVRSNIVNDRVIKDKLRNPTKIDSPSLPNTEAEMSMGGSR
jgi:hypothetical protein